MNAILSTRVLLVLTIVYGGVIAILGAIGTSAVGLVAVIGAVIIGGLWAVRGAFNRPPS
jgi:hypothetical protein